MKNLSSLIFLSCIYLFANAQSAGNLTIFSEAGNKFYVFLDGIKQNDVASANIRIQELPDLYYAVKIVFTDSSLSPIVKNNLYISDGEDIMRDAAYRIRKDKGNKSRLVFYSIVPVRKNYVPVPGESVYHFGQQLPVASALPVEKKTTNTEPSNTGSLNIFSQNGEKFYLFLDGIKQNDTPRTNIKIQGLGDFYYHLKIVFTKPGVLPIIKNHIYISDEENGMMNASYRIRRDQSFRMKLNFFSMKPIHQKADATAGMYVYDVKSVKDTAERIVIASAPAIKSQPAVAKITPPVTKAVKPSSLVVKSQKPKIVKHKKKVDNYDDEEPEISVAKTGAGSGGTGMSANTASEVKPTIEREVETTGNKKCSGWPLGTSDLAEARKSIQKAKNDEARLMVAKIITSSNCLTCSQVRELCSLFQSEKIKLEFAKYAYMFTLDKKKYTDVNKALSSDEGRNELTKFITSTN